MKTKLTNTETVYVYAQNEEEAKLFAGWTTDYEPWDDKEEAILQGTTMGKQVGVRHGDKLYEVTTKIETTVITVESSFEVVKVTP